MKFYAYCNNKTLSDNNGGSLVLWHHLHALAELGHESGGMLDLTEGVPPDADYIMFQSEWYGVIKNHLNVSRARRICWLGHINPAAKYGMPRIQDIKADHFHTQYQGDSVDYAAAKLGKRPYYLPHAACSCIRQGDKIEAPKALFIGTPFPERAEDWLDYAGVTKLRVPFAEINDYYRSATVCPNIHGDFQKHKKTEFFQVPGYMINERIFQIIMSGGFALSDNNPIVKEFFTSEEVPYAETKEDFKYLIDYFLHHPEERLPYMEKAKQRIISEHLYTHRWKDYLSELALTGRTTS